MKKDKSKNNNEMFVLQNSSNTNLNAFELINKYGTYNIQSTADTENEFPKISQGLPTENTAKTDKKN